MPDPLPVLTFPSGPFAIPTWAAWDGGEPRPCRACSRSILFVKTLKLGKMAPIDPDGTSHFATCPSAARFRKPKEKR